MKLQLYLWSTCTKHYCDVDKQMNMHFICEAENNYIYCVQQVMRHSQPQLLGLGMHIPICIPMSQHPPCQLGV
jgi:hypothetical protein